MNEWILRRAIMIMLKVQKRWDKPFFGDILAWMMRAVEPVV